MLGCALWAGARLATFPDFRLARSILALAAGGAPNQYWDALPTLKMPTVGYAMVQNVSNVQAECDIWDCQDIVAARVVFLMGVGSTLSCR